MLFLYPKWCGFTFNISLCLWFKMLICIFSRCSSYWVHTGSSMLIHISAPSFNQLPSCLSKDYYEFTALYNTKWNICTIMWMYYKGSYSKINYLVQGNDWVFTMHTYSLGSTWHARYRWTTRFKWQWWGTRTRWTTSTLCCFDIQVICMYHCRAHQVQLDHLVKWVSMDL